MDITEFLQQSCGKWFSQRTSHLFASKKSESDKSDIQIEMLPKDASEVVQLCKQYNVDSALALCGIRATWSRSADWEQRKQTGSVVWVPIADANNPNEGKLLRDGSYAEKAVVGRYVMGNDDSLTLITEDGTTHAEERLWFASPNLRLRTSMLKRSDGFSTATFYSEIRMGGVQPAADASKAAEQTA